MLNCCSVFHERLSEVRLGELLVASQIERERASLLAFGYPLGPRTGFIPCRGRGQWRIG